MQALEDLFNKISKKQTEPKGPVRERWLIVGLGNPGDKYAQNWHNLGWMALDVFAQKHGADIRRIQFKGLTDKVRIGDIEAILLKPTTYMNLSGESVREACDFYKIPPDHVLVLVDDIDLALGVIRLRDRGSSAHHNGMKSVIQHLGTDQFPRLRLGFGPQDRHKDIVDVVLSDIPKNQQKIVFEQLTTAADGIPMILKQGVEKAQSKLNGQASETLRRQEEEAREARRRAKEREALLKKMEQAERDDIKDTETENPTNNRE